MKLQHLFVEVIVNDATQVWICQAITLQHFFVAIIVKDATQVWVCNYDRLWRYSTSL